MDLSTITMDREEARRAFIEYKNAVKAKHNAEDEEIMRGYQALARGRQLLHLANTIKAGGADEQGRPRLAVMRATAEWCWLQVSTDGAVIFSDDRWQPRGKKRYIELPPDTMPRREGFLSMNQNRALVPPVPPRFRPNASLEHYHVLWEAEWRQVAPADPALLRHIGGDLYAVLAVWDLTELERAVLARRFA